jgi:hypothetical protein
MSLFMEALVNMREIGLVGRMLGYRIPKSGRFCPRGGAVWRR